MADVSIPFERLDGPAPFRDCIVMSQAEYDALAPSALEAMKQARFSSWLAAVTPSPDEGEGDG